MTEDIIQFELPSGHVVTIDRSDAHLLAGRNWFLARRGPCLYAEGRKKGRPKDRTLLHRLIMRGVRADHIDGNGLNNRRKNLRPCTQAQNGLNRGPKAGKRFKGVYQKGSKFYCQIYLNRRAYTLHSFKTAEDAARAYDAMAIDLHGEFARLNFPDTAELEEAHVAHP